jgi:hypothetical protein
MDYFDILLAKKLSGGSGGDVEVESLTATENGTYNAGAGKAYNPVVVAVPEPTLITKSITENGTYNASDDNADGYSSVTVDVEGYQIKNIANVPTDIASFTDGTDLPMLKLEVGIEAVQDLHGYDAPWVGGAGKNICPDKHYQRNARAYVLGTDEDNVYPFSLVSGQPYTFSLKTSVTTSIQLYVREENQSTAVPYALSNNAATFTPSITGNYIFVLATALQDTPFSAFSEIMLEKGSTKTSYAPYSNICPISGWSSVGVTVAGANVWDEQTEGGTYNNTTGEPQNASTLTRCKNFIKVNPSESYYLVIGSTSALNILQYGKNKEYLGSSTLIQNTASREFSVTANTYYIRFYFAGTTYNNDISINYPSSDTAYHAYNGTTYTIQLGDTYYGATLDVTSGVLTVTHANIASYNGESVNEPWISSEDAYESGATPTTGAQVVYPLTTPLTVQLTPTQIKSLLGQNNLFVDSGQIISGQYFAEL